MLLSSRLSIYPFKVSVQPFSYYRLSSSMPAKRAQRKNPISAQSVSNVYSKKGKRTMGTSTLSEDKQGTASSESESSTIYFWREYGTEHCFLSQWYNSPFTTDKDPGLVYLHAEQYMMYHKALLFNDSETADKILEETDQKTIKGLGRQVTPFDDKTWYANRERIVEEASYFKFKNGKAEGEDMKGEVGEVGVLLKKLLETGDRELVEASPFDKIWGVGFGVKNAEKSRSKWGLNLLGKALMTARQRLREEAENTAPK